MVLRKKEVYTIITPIPPFIPRQLAIDILHSHGEVINLNPLVLGHKKIDAPRNAAADEYFSTWYEITERVQFVPGMGKFGSGKISFNACFHDLPWGLQTHVYAPLGIDMRNKYRIGGNQSGFEPPEPPEIGLAELGIPKDGLYLREDIEIRCNITMVATVKAQMKASSKEMVGRIIKKAELIDAGVLQAMIKDGMMKTYKPQGGTYTVGLDSQPRSPPLSPAVPYAPAFRTSPDMPYQVPRPVSANTMQNRPGTSLSITKYPPSPSPRPLQKQQQQQQWMNSGQFRRESIAAEMQALPMELPGDFYYSQRSQHPQHFQSAAPVSVELPAQYDVHKPLAVVHEQNPQVRHYNPASYAGVVTRP
ncbi:hypothetical protein F4861DRAFT_486313 [Xylaria intraflava]|nr:hypothetical protein F4861DRAFT_486313 [Xylaria intraflava]